MIIFIYSDALFESIALVKNYNDFHKFIDGSIVLLTMIGVCGKIANAVIKRKEILQLINILKADPCLCQNDEEKTIQDKFDKTIK